LVIGGGVIGLELGSVYARLGAEVTVVEYLDRIIPGNDGEVAKAFQRLLQKQGMKFILGAAVHSATAAKGKATVSYKLRKDDSDHTLEADTVLLATGRRPFVEGLGLEAVGVKMTDRGQIATNGKFATNIKSIYAIGDAIEGPMLAHKAMDDGHALADLIAGHAGHVDYNTVPGVIYTTPEVASVGATEESLKEAGRAYKVGKVSFMSNGRAKAVFQGDGFVKLLADKDTDRILGAHIIGPMAGDLIHEICVAMEFGAAAEDLALTCHAHPTYSEAVREAALACGDGAIHA
jgi:dihydrolipoamide dehydrogenase